MFILVPVVAAFGFFSFETLVKLYLDGGQVYINSYKFGTHRVKLGQVFKNDEPLANSYSSKSLIF